jgi:hypothetical protein
LNASLMILCSSVSLLGMTSCLTCRLWKFVRSVVLQNSYYRFRFVLSDNLCVAMKWLISVVHCRVQLIFWWVFIERSSNQWAVTSLMGARYSFFVLIFFYGSKQYHCITSL